MHNYYAKNTGSNGEYQARDMQSPSGAVIVEDTTFVKVGGVYIEAVSISGKINGNYHPAFIKADGRYIN